MFDGDSDGSLAPSSASMSLPSLASPDYGGGSDRFARFAWALWRDFSKRSANDRSGSSGGGSNGGDSGGGGSNERFLRPDLTMFNVALRVASRLPGAPELLEATFQELQEAAAATSTSSEISASASGNCEGPVAVEPPDIYTFNALVAGFAMAGDVARCKRIAFEDMPAAGVAPNMITFNTLINACVVRNNNSNSNRSLPYSSYSSSGGIMGGIGGVSNEVGGDLDEALALVDAAVERGIKPDHVTFRSLCHAFGHSNAMVEAIQAAERAALNADASSKSSSTAAAASSSSSSSDASSPFSSSSTLGSGAATASSSLSAASLLDEEERRGVRLLEERLLRRPSSSSFSSSYSSGAFEEGGSYDNGSNARWAYEVDLHELGVSEAKARITRELDAIHEIAWRSVRSSGAAGDNDNDTGYYDNAEEEQEQQRPPSVATDGGEGGLQQQRQQQQRGASAAEDDGEVGEFRDLRLPELILITGTGRHSRQRGVSVVREAVAAVLDEKGIKYTEPAGNAGRVVIAPRDLEAFLMRHNTEQIWTSLSQHISFRYVVAPSLLASVLVLPKLFAFYANIPQ
jgi:hypothetical protein